VWISQSQALYEAQSPATVILYIHLIQQAMRFAVSTIEIYVNTDMLQVAEQFRTLLSRGSNNRPATELFWGTSPRASRGKAFDSPADHVLPPKVSKVMAAHL
jgi:hypothetical protein